MKTTVGFIGTGNMGSAIITGLSHRSDVSLLGFDLNRSKLSALAEDTGLIPQGSLAELTGNCRYLVLAVKPQHMKPLLGEIGPMLRADQCIISVAAGIPVKKLRKWSGEQCPVVRVMPNTPALVGQGVFALCLEDPSLSSEQQEMVSGFFTAQGAVHVLEERLFDAYTAVIGSGPAYVYYVMEALIEAAVTLGIPRDKALDMVLGLFKGSVSLASGDEHTVAQLREMVCSPGGSTLAGLNHFDRQAVRGAIIDGVTLAWKRNRELGD
ncbi:MAG: pyrroline-5-carboxylate reductase [Desulfovibrionales bacterium]